MRKSLYKVDVAVSLFTWCPAVAETSEKSLPVQVIDGKNTSAHLGMKPKSCTLQENKLSFCNTADGDFSSYQKQRPYRMAQFCSV